VNIGHKICVISGFRRGVIEILFLIRCYVAYSVSLYRRFEITYRSYLLLELLDS
jgi:hypothetical protein